MNDHGNISVAAPTLKIISAWAAALGLQSWGDVASFLAALYTALLIAEWIRNRFKRNKRNKRTDKEIK